MTEHIVAVGPDLPDSLACAIREGVDEQNPGVLVRHLESLIDLEISGLLIYGSLAGRASPRGIDQSDVDLLVLTAVDAVGGVFGTTQGIQVDLHVQAREQTLEDPVRNWVYADGEVLFDNALPELQHWLEALQHWKSESKDPWTKADRLRGKVWAYRLLDRVERLRATDPAQAMLHEARLLAALPELHAQLHRRRTTSISHWWRATRQDDADLAGAFEVYEIQRASGSLAALRTLVDRLFVESALEPTL